MKSLVSTLLVTFVVLISGLLNVTYGANDTLVVYANSDKTLDQIISADVTSGGA